jgi:hypothetical protein
VKKSIITVFVAMSLSGMAFGADKKSPKKGAPPPEPTTEQREGMAKSMESMAACLRSTKTMRECHEEMEKNCEANMGAETCHRMHGMDGKHGMHHEMMEETPAPKK